MQEALKIVQREPDKVRRRIAEIAERSGHKVIWELQDNGITRIHFEDPTGNTPPSRTGPLRPAADDERIKLTDVSIYDNGIPYIPVHEYGKNPHQLPLISVKPGTAVFRAGELKIA